MKNGLTKADFTIGAIYRVGLRRDLSREQIVDLLIKRARMTGRQADQLVGHWLTSEPYRMRRRLREAA